MSVTVLLEVTAKPEYTDTLIDMFANNFKETRQYEGNIDIYMTRDHDDPNTLVLVEQWETRPHYERYLAWRTETGVGEKLASMAAAGPTIRYFDRMDA